MAERPQTYLMLDPVQGHIFPFSSRGLTMLTDAPKNALARNASALFLNDRGQVVRIVDAKLNAPGILTTLRLALGGSAAGEYELQDANMSLTAFRDMMLEVLTKTSQRDDADEDWWLFTAPMDEIRAGLFAAPDLAALHAMMRFPADEDCLDLL